MTTEAAAQAGTPEKGLGFFRYAVNFTKGLIRDSRFWSRFNAIPNGVVFVAQGVAGAIALAGSAPVIAQAAGIAGCAMLAGVGLYGIGYGLPRAWQSMEALCRRTFPAFNPLKKIRMPVQAFAQKMAQTRLARKILKSPLTRLKPELKTERQQDVFLAGLTLEGASVSAVVCGMLIAPLVMALPAVSIAGALGIAWGAWVIGTCVFDVYCAGKTLAHAFRDWRRERKEKKAAAAKPPQPPAPPPQAPESPKANPAPAAPAFNATAEKTAAAPPPETSPEAPPAPKAAPPAAPSR